MGVLQELKYSTVYISRAQYIRSIYLSLHICIYIYIYIHIHINIIYIYIYIQIVYYISMFFEGSTPLTSKSGVEPR